MKKEIPQRIANLLWMINEEIKSSDGLYRDNFQGSCSYKKNWGLFRFPQELEDVIRDFDISLVLN